MRLTTGILHKTLAPVVLAAVMTAAVLAQDTQQPAPDPATAATPSAPTASSAAPGTVATSQKSYTLEVGGSKGWIDTNIDLRDSEKVQITAEGTITYAKGNHFGPAGITRSLADVIHQYAVPNGAHGELIGRLGAGDASESFEVGAGTTYTAPVAGHLFLGINQSVRDAEGATGSFQVKIEVVDSGLTTPEGMMIGGPAEVAMPAITSKLLDQIPRRIGDKDHNPGDMVNILIVGSEDEVVKTFTTAEWVKVDQSVEGTVMAGLLDTIAKKDYLTMPMSTLYLFDRPQDYGFAHAEPVRVVMARNHLRVWKSPYMVSGRPLWCVAATHDIGFERDQRNNGLTHKIDPAIDGEREYVNQTLSATGLVSARAHIAPTNPLTTAKTATGGEFHSDGKILVLVLKSGIAAN
jgi:hypothetical protein